MKVNSGVHALTVSSPVPTQTLCEDQSWSGHRTELCRYLQIYTILCLPTPGMFDVGQNLWLLFGR